MNPEQLKRRTMELITAYYDNDTQPYLEALDEQAQWYGPAKGQFLSGRQAIVDAWRGEENPLTFSVGNIRLNAVSAHPSSCEVMMSFSVVTHFPSGVDIPVDQSIHFSWCERRITDENGVKRSVPRILMVHITNLYQQHESDRIYPVHYDRLYQGYLPISMPGKRLRLRGNNHAEYFLLPESVFWVSSCADSRHSLVHMKDETVEVLSSIRQIAQACPDNLLRCHSSYLVNPLHVRSIRRFSLTLDTGETLAIPEKKYTKFKAELQTWAEEQNRREAAATAARQERKHS